MYFVISVRGRSSPTSVPDTKYILALFFSEGISVIYARPGSQEILQCSICSYGTLVHALKRRYSRKRSATLTSAMLRRRQIARKKGEFRRARKARFDGLR